MTRTQSPIVDRRKTTGADTIIVEFAESPRRWAVLKSAKPYFSSLLVLICLSTIDPAACKHDTALVRMRGPDAMIQQ